MKKKVPCEADAMRAAIIDILSERENEADGHGQSLTVNELQGILERDFEFSGEELGNVLNGLNLNGKIMVTLKAIETEDELLVVVDQMYLSPSKKEETVTVNNTHDLIRVISVGIGELLIAKVRLWDGRVVKGSRYKGEKIADFITVGAFISAADKMLQGLIMDKLLQRGESFIVQTGTGDELLLVEWSISAAE